MWDRCLRPLWVFRRTFENPIIFVVAPKEQGGSTLLIGERLATRKKGVVTQASRLSAMSEKDLEILARLRPEAHSTFRFS